MLQQHDLSTVDNQRNATYEVMQQVVLSGLYRGGFFKEAARFCKKIPGSVTSKTKAYIQEIDGLILVEPKWIPVKTDRDITKLQRPLRAQTAQGPRIALSNSEMIEPGCTLEFTVRCLNPADFKLVEEWLEYGKYHGLGQWRNSGCGRFTWEEIKE